MKLSYFCIATTLLLSPTLSAFAQEEGDKVRLSGSIQTDFLLPQKDTKLGINNIEHKVLNNTYVDVNASYKNFDAGVRLEYMQHPLPGFEQDFKGWGIPHFYLKGRFNKVELTLGHFYEQFGAGFALRSYEERSLGIDNSILGARIVATPFDGVRLKALAGKQRRYWKLNPSFISGADLELNLEQWIKPLQQSETYLSVGASLVNKNEKDEDILVGSTHRLNLPHNVSVVDARVQLQHKGVNILAECAFKGQDPTLNNNYIYRKGYVTMLSCSYSKSGLGAIVQAKRSVNMGFRGVRSMDGLSSFINHMPPFTMEHTYTLAALYPYSTHPDGEWAYQCSLNYTFKKGSPLGGAYGTKVKFNASHVHAIQNNGLNMPGKDGYGSAFWKWGDATYYQDINLQVEKKLSKSTQIGLMYMNQRYNETAIKGEGGMLRNNIFIAELKQKLSHKTTLRAEAQYLNSADGDKDWLFALAEVSFSPHWMVSVSDLFNSGSTKQHYYQSFVGYYNGAHRIQLGYQRTRAGYNCAGGVCRYVPASKGLSLSYNYNF